MPPLTTFSKSCLALALGQTLILPGHASEIVVNDASDMSVSDIKCTLREAINSANTNPGNTNSGCVSGESGIADAITFDPFTFPASSPDPIILVSSLPDVSSDLTISAQESASVTIDANNTNRVLRVFNATISLENLIITGGSATDGGGGGLALGGSTTVGGNIGNGSVTITF